MNEQLARGLPPLDDEYQGPSWWHLSRLADVRHSPGMRRIALPGPPGERGRGGHRHPERDLRLERHPDPARPVPRRRHHLPALPAEPPRRGVGRSHLGDHPCLRREPRERHRERDGPVDRGVLRPGRAPSRSSSSGARWSRSTSTPSCVAGATCAASWLSASSPPSPPPSPSSSRTPPSASTPRGAAHLAGLGHRRHPAGAVGGGAAAATSPVPRVRAWIDRQFAAPPRYEVTYTRAAILAAVTFSLIALLVFVGIYMLQESLEHRPRDPHRRGASCSCRGCRRCSSTWACSWRR